MTRRGDVYIVDALMAGRPIRLIVSAHDGRVLERYAVAPRWRDAYSDRPRWRDDLPRRSRDDDDEGGAQAALGDPSHPRVLNFDDQNPASPPDVLPPERAPAITSPKAGRALGGERRDPEPSMAAVAPSDPKPTRVIDLPQAKAAPAKPEVKILPAPEPTTQAKVETPKRSKRRSPFAKRRRRSNPKRPKAVRQVGPTQAKAEDRPKPEDKPKAEDKPKVETPRKKLNDLPVGTLD